MPHDVTLSDEKNRIAIVESGTSEVQITGLDLSPEKMALLLQAMLLWKYGLVPIAE